MADFFEIDFLDVECGKSGDAITLRYSVNGIEHIHIVDGGFQETGPSVIRHVTKYYDPAPHITHVVATHADGDHLGGLRAVLEGMNVATLWMLRPWAYAAELVQRFPTYNSVDALARRLRFLYPNIAALEEIAISRRIPIYEPFQGAVIGAFTVLSPSKTRYLDLIVRSDRTPEGTEARSMLQRAASEVRSLLAEWGIENFSSNETSAENEMSVVQYAILCNKSILLTADAGRTALSDAADYLVLRGGQLPGIDRFQVPHHGSRRNVSTQILDRWLGPRLHHRPADGSALFEAIVSSAKADEHHPRKAVIRAMIHRGAAAFATEGKTLRIQVNAPPRGWKTAPRCDYPESQEA